MRIPFQRNTGQHAGIKNILNMRLPPCPDPECTGCHAKLKDVRPLHIEPLTAQIYDVHVLSQCHKCRTPHYGKRSIAFDKGKTRFLDQKIERYAEAVHGPMLKKITQKIHQKKDKFDRIQEMPVTAHPDEVVIEHEG